MAPREVIARFGGPAQFLDAIATRGLYTALSPEELLEFPLETLVALATLAAVTRLSRVTPPDEIIEIDENGVVSTNGRGLGPLRAVVGTLDETQAFGVPAYGPTGPLEEDPP